MSAPYPPLNPGNRAQRRAQAGRERSKRVRAQRRASKGTTLSRNPVMQAALRQQVEDCILRLRTRAGLHAYAGEDAAAVAEAMGSLVFMVAHAAGACGLGSSPEAGVLRGCARALADVAATPAALEQQRAAIVSGLAAAERLLPGLDTWSLAVGAQALDELLRHGDLTALDVDRALREPTPSPFPSHQP